MIRQRAKEWAFAAIAPTAMLLAALALPGGELPLFDDWDYRDTVEEFLRTGQMRLSDWPSVTLVAQIWWGAAFAAVGGASHAVLRVSTLVATALGCLSLYFVARRLRLGRARSAFLALALAFTPVGWLHANSFMTDLPGMALTLALLHAGGAWLGGTRIWRAGPPRGALSAFAALAALAYLCRQTAAMPAFALVGVLMLRWPWRTLCWCVMPLTVVVLAHRFWLTEMHGLPYFATWPRTDPTLLQSWPKFARRVADVALGAGFLTAPALLALLDFKTAIRWRTNPRAWLGAGAGAALAIAAVRTGSVAPFGDALFDFGVGSVSEVRGLETLPKFPGAERHAFRTACQVLAGVALTAGGAALATAGRRRSRAACRSTVPGMLLASALAFLASLLFGMSVFDRYFVPLACLGGLLATALLPGLAKRRAPGAAGWLALGVLAAIAVVGVHDHFVRQRAYWAGLESLLAAGVRATDINGNLEFGGVHRFAPHYRGPPRRRAFLLALSAEQRMEFALLTPHQIHLNRRAHTVAFAPLPGHAVLRRIDFRGWSGAGAAFVLRREAVAGP